MGDDQLSGTGYVPFPSFSDWHVGGFDTSDIDRYSQMLAKAKNTASPEALEEAMTTAMRYAAVDTNAIEGLYNVDRGFTRTIATQAAAWESVMESRGSHIRPAFDDAINGYEYVLNVATQSVEVSELWIKELHATICASQDSYTVYTPQGPSERPLPKGTYKTMPNSPTRPDGKKHHYAPVIDTVPEMERLIGELRSEAFLSAPAVLQAAYAHYAYVCIHPFADGNGRVARALSSGYLYRSPGVPLIVFADQRNEYYDALESADDGDPFLFIQFVLTRTIDAIGIIRSMLQRTSPPIHSTLAGLVKLFHSDPDVEELHAAAVRLRSLAMAEAGKQLKALAFPAGLSVTSSGAQRLGNPPLPSGYRDLGHEAVAKLTASCSWPYNMRSRLQYEVAIRSDETAPSDLLLISRATDGIEVWLRELVPVETETLKLKLEGWVQGRIGDLLVDVENQIQQNS